MLAYGGSQGRSMASLAYSLAAKAINSDVLMPSFDPAFAQTSFTCKGIEICTRTFLFLEDTIKF